MYTYRDAIRYRWSLNQATDYLDDRHYRRFENLWTWGAPRFSEPYATIRHEWRVRHGEASLLRREARAKAIIAALMRKD